MREDGGKGKDDMDMKQKVELDVAGRPLILESGWIAKQAHGSVWARYGDTVVLAVATAAKAPKPGLDFFPLTRSEEHTSELQSH